MENQRSIILDILLEKENNPVLNLDEVIEIKCKNLNYQEKGFIKTVVYGTIRYQFRLDHIIKKMSKIKLKKLNRKIVNILRLSLYQLIYMPHVEEFAVVNESVNLTKNISHKGNVSFVNGVLRNFLRNKDKFMYINIKDRYKYLSIKYSFPIWIIKEIELAYGKDNLEKNLMAFNEEPVLTIRYNPLKISLENLKDNLENKGYKVIDTIASESGLLIKNPVNLFNTDIYKNGLFYVQSESAQLATEIIDLHNKNSFLDLCAAPGGKITHIYELKNGKGNYIATDINDKKLSIIKENLDRLGHKNIDLIINDGTILNNDFIDNFDLVYCDVPCSALGLIRKYPDMKYQKSKEDIEELYKIQKQILDNGSNYVKNKGLLIYSTCTFTLKENEKVIEEFLNDNHNFQLIYNRKISPTDFNSDGFTINILKRID